MAGQGQGKKKIIKGSSCCYSHDKAKKSNPKANKNKAS